MKTRNLLAIAALMAGVTVSAQQMQGMPKHDMKGGMKEHMEHLMPTKAIAVLFSAPDSEVQGTVTFEKVDAGIKVVADVTGLTPGKHGFHIHEYGDCSASDFTSAGSHFMLDDEHHGAPGDTMSHMGDLGNLTADASGHAHLEWISSEISFMGPSSILGRSVIVHEKEDDLKTQPTGGAGPRVACGVIGIAKQ